MAPIPNPKSRWRNRLLALTIAGITYLLGGFYFLATGAVRPTYEQWTIIGPATGIAAVLVASGWMLYAAGHWSDASASNSR